MVHLVTIHRFRGFLERHCALHSADSFLKAPCKNAARDLMMLAPAWVFVFSTYCAI
jgi:hypothetical protein